MKAVVNKGELTVFFDHPKKELDVYVFGIDEIDYNCDLQSLSFPEHIYGSHKDWPKVAEADFTLDDKGRYRLYNNIRIEDGESSYSQYGGSHICNPLEAEI